MLNTSLSRNKYSKLNIPYEKTQSKESILVDSADDTECALTICLFKLSLSASLVKCVGVKGVGNTTSNGAFIIS